MFLLFMYDKAFLNEISLKLYTQTFYDNIYFKKIFISLNNIKRSVYFSPVFGKKFFIVISKHMTLYMTLYDNI